MVPQVSSYPWFKFYPRGWRGNQGLRVVSLAARGLWLEMLAIMHEGQPYARLAINGKAIPVETLARMVGARPEEVRRLLKELESAGILTKARNGVIHSPRMAKERTRSEKGREGASKRWSQVPVAKDEIATPIGSPIAQKQEVRFKKADVREEPVGSSRGHRLPGGWQLPLEQRLWTRERFPSVSSATLELELEKFASYWTAKEGSGAVKQDWDAAWRVWAIEKWQATVNAGSPQPRQTVRLHRHLERELFEACERLQMKPAPSDEWKFPEPLVRQAQRDIGHGTSRATN